MGDHIKKGRSIHPFTQTQGHGLGRCRDMHAGKQLVDDLDLAARAGLVAQAVDIAGHGIEQGTDSRVGLGRGSGHHGHLATSSLGGAARNGRIDIKNAELGQACLQGDGPVRVDRGTHHKHTAGRHGGGAALVAKQHRLGLGSVDHHRHNHLAVCCEFGGRSTGHATLRNKGLRHLCTHIKHMDLAAMAAQGARHAAAHGTEAN